MNIQYLSIPRIDIPPIHFSLPTDISAYQPLLIPTIALIVALLALCIAQRDTVSEIERIFRYRVFYYPIVAPGTILHETSHAIMYFLMGVPIANFAPFHPQHLMPEDADVLGYVRPVYEPGFFRRTIDSFAPLYLIPPLLVAITVALLGTTDPSHLVSALVNAGPLRAVVWIFLVVLGGRAAGPSRGDIYSRVALSFIVCLISAVTIVALGFVGVTTMVAVITAMATIYGLVAALEIMFFVVTKIF